MASHRLKRYVTTKPTAIPTMHQVIGIGPASSWTDTDTSAMAAVALAVNAPEIVGRNPALPMSEPKTRPNPTPPLNSTMKPLIFAGLSDVGKPAYMDFNVQPDEPNLFTVRT